MKSLMMVITVTAMATVGISDDHSGGSVKSVSRDAPFRAYWLMAPDEGKRAEYQHLLVTHGAIEELAGHSTWSPFPLDNMAMTFRTYKRDSLWDKPFLGIKVFGAIDAASKTAVVDGASYLYEPCPLADVVKLLDKPLGSLPISRISDPLQGAEHTAKAFRLLLEEQMKTEKADK